MPSQVQLKTIINACATLVLKLSKALLDIKDINRHDMWQLHSDRDPPQQYAHARRILDQIVSRLRAANPSMISERLILDRLLYKVAATVLDYPTSDEEIMASAVSEIDKLVHSQAWRTVDVPLVNLQVTGGPLPFGPLTFHPLSDLDRSHQWWTRVQSFAGSSAITDVVGYASVRAPGDIQLATDYASNTVNEMLLILRAVGLPVTTKPLLQFGVLNDHPIWKSRPLRLRDLDANPTLESPSEYVELLGPGIAPYRVNEDLLSKVPEMTLAGLQALLATDFLQPTSEMKSKFFMGLRWLGQATLPDSPDAKFAKLSFALESLVGGEASGGYLTSRGLTAMLAERSAFIATTDPIERMAIHKNISDYYGRRSDIVHGGKAEITEPELVGFATVVRRVAWSLLHRLDTLSTIDNLQSWVLQCRYGTS